ncbi:MAG: ATP-binding protein [Cyanobacteria bacterium J06621_11]
MKLQAKILSGYAASLTLVVLVGLWGVVNLRQLGQASDNILQENYRSIRAADGMIDALERQDSATLILLFNDTASGRDLFRENEILFLQRLGRAKDNVTLNDESETLEALELAYSDYLANVDELALLTDFATDSASRDVAVYETQLRPAFQAVRESATKLRDLNQSAMSLASEQASMTSRNAIISVAIAGFAASLVGLVISWILSRNLVRPVKAMYSATGQIADGNYDIQLDVQTSDELGQLAKEINVMSQRLQSFKALNLNKIVAEKQRSEAIIHSLSDGIVVVDDQLHVVAINPVAAAIFNTKSSLALGQHCLEIIENQALYDQIQSALCSDGRSKDLSETLSQGADVCSELVVEDNTTEHYQYLTTPVTTAENQRLGVVLLLQNVTNLKQLDQLKSEFVMTASHELRTPLTGMAMSIDLLKETAQKKLSDVEQELLSTAQGDVQRLRDLVNDLLDLSKIESGQIELDVATVDPKEIVEKAVDLLKVQSDQQAIQVNSEVASNLPNVRADPNKMTWVLTNLIANALRYANRTINIIANPHGSWIFIAVVDDGPGIDPAYQSKIFDKFVQVKTEKDVGGTGLGLAICKEMIKAHGGSIWVESTPGEGCKFAFTLPTVSASSVSSAADSSSSASSSASFSKTSTPQETTHA